MQHVSISQRLLCALLFIANFSFSQHQHLAQKPAPTTGFCAQSEMMERAFRKSPKLWQRQEDIEKQIYKAFHGLDKAGKQLPPTYTLPVVVHIIHNGGAENLSDATVVQGIQDLNDAFANIGYYDPTSGVDTKIQFCLAQRDPNGNATTGITRNVSALTDMNLDTDDLTVKNLNRWDPTQYINIWLVKEICSFNGCGVAGYAYLPSSHGLPHDGIMMEAEYFGSSHGASGVQIHEMGHYLGLYHTFQGGCVNNNCLSDGDRVCDTPPDQSTAAVPCGTAVNSCSTDTNSGFGTDQNDLIEDYMDYGDFNCWSVFTQGQADRMAWHIENIRPSLLDSKGCVDPCTSALTASFSASGSAVNVGGSVNFTSTSTNSTNYAWTVNGAAFAGTQNASYTFSAVGQFEVCLTVGNADPNCSDRACKTINVTCPVVASFTTSNLYPAPGQQVVFSNASTNANSYAWKVDGVPAGSSANLTYTFTDPGNKRVCLTASNGLCSKEFCQQVFVIEISGSGACDTSFLRTYGTPLGNERGQALVEIPAALGGGFLIGGSKLDSAMLTRLDVSGNIVWTRCFDATSEGPTDVPDIISDLIFDSDNNVVGCGHTYDEPDGNFEGFIFKYNIAANDILWVNELDLWPDPALEVYTSVSEKSPGGNYIVTGTINTAVGTSTTGENGTILEVNRNNGNNVWQFNYNLGSSENFQKTILHNGAIYTTGRYNFDNGGTARMRPGVTKMNLNGVQQWSKLYLRAVTSSTNARLYSSDIVADNGIVVLGHGDNAGTSTSNVTLFLLKTDNEGNLLWAMNYDIPGANTEVSTKLLSLPDGYLCLGYYTASSQDVFLFKTDKQGQLQWSKSYGNTAAEDAHDMVFANGQIYFTGKTKAAAPGSTFDTYFANIGVDGTANALDSCNLFSDLNMTATPYSNPYNAQHNLANLNQNWANFIDDYIVTETAVQSTTVCFQPCLDTCEVVPNAFYQTASATCLGDSLLVSLTACNIGNFDLPAGTPVSFYLGNPTTTNAALIGTYTLPQALVNNECGTFQYAILAPPNTTIYVMLNDDGTTPRPFTLADFMADIMECEYGNNLGGFMHDFTAPVLNLGPDISACENGVTVLDAGPGFASYRWQDGSTEQTLTAFSPGTYSVTVTDACGGTQSDMVHISTDPATVLDLGPDLGICAGGSQTLIASGFVSYQWSPADYLSCTNCPNPTITPTANISYMVVATNAAGCISVDTVAVSVLPSFESVEDVVLCEGDTVMVFGMPVTASGEFTQTFTSSVGCDSIFTVSVGMIEIVESVEDVVLCEGDTVMIFGMPVSASGQFSQTFTSAAGCDSIVTVSVGLIEIVESVEDIVLCEGDTVMVFGMPVTASGQFSQTFTSAAGCDSIVTVNVGMIPKVYTQESLRICQGETVDIFGTPTSMAGIYSMTFASAATGCDSIHTVTLTVDAISLGITSTNVSCNSLGSATATVSSGNGPFSYYWSNSATTPTITGIAAGPNGASSYTVTVTDANGCTNSATATIQGALGPGASITVLAQLTEDEPDNGKLTALATGGTAPFNFAWSSTGTSNSGNTATIDSLSSGAYTVTVTDANGCTASATAYLYVPACTGGKIWNDMDRDGCQDAPTAGSSETGIGQVTLFLAGTTTWGQPVADTTVSAINGEYIFEGLAPGNYTVKIKLPTNWSLSPAKACNDDTHDSDFNTTTLLSGVVNLVEGHCCLTVDGGLFDACLNLTTTGQICCDQTLCGPGNDPAPITSLVPAGGGGGATQYLWMYSTLGGPTGASPMGSNWTTIAGANGPSYDPGPLSQTTHFVRCAKSATCSTWLESNFVTITVADVAVADILPTGPICINDPVTFTAAANGAGAVYNWDFGPWATPSTSSQPSVSVVFSQAGVTNVALSVGRNDCVSTDAISITVSNNPVYCGMGISQPGSDGRSATAPTSVQVAGQFTAYPNPFSDGLTVAWGAGVETVVAVKLYSVEGRMLHSGQSSDGETQYRAEVGSLLPGVYLLHLQSQCGQSAVFKVVKEKQ